VFFAMPAIMTARRHALSHPHFQAGTDTLTRILSPTIFPGNTGNDAVGYRGIYRWPFPRSSSTWEATDAPWRHASEDSLTFITSTAARSNEQGHQSYQGARTPSSDCRALTATLRRCRLWLLTYVLTRKRRISLTSEPQIVEHRDRRKRDKWRCQRGNQRVHNQRRDAI
jgi:hypothetical protein